MPFRSDICVHHDMTTAVLRAKADSFGVALMVSRNIKSKSTGKEKKEETRSRQPHQPSSACLLNFFLFRW